MSPIKFAAVLNVTYQICRGLKCHTNTTCGPCSPLARPPQRTSPLPTSAEASSLHYARATGTVLSFCRLPRRRYRHSDSLHQSSPFCGEPGGLPSSLTTSFVLLSIAIISSSSSTLLLGQDHLHELRAPSFGMWIVFDPLELRWLLHRFVDLAQGAVSFLKHDQRSWSAAASVALDSDVNRDNCWPRVVRQQQLMNACN